MGYSCSLVHCWVSIWNLTLPSRPSQLHVPYCPQCWEAIPWGQEEKSSSNSTSVPLSFQVYFFNTHSSIHWEIFVGHLLWARLWTSSSEKHCQIQILKNHLIEVDNYYLSQSHLIKDPSQTIVNFRNYPPHIHKRKYILLLSTVINPVI